MSRRVIALISISMLLIISSLCADSPQWKKFINSKQVNSLADDGEHLWIGTSQGGITKFHKKSGEKEYITIFNSNLNSSSVEDILLSPDSTIWVNTPRDLYRFSNGTFEDVTTLFPIQRLDAASAVFFDSKGNLWISYKYFKSNGNEWAVGVFNDGFSEIYTSDNSVLDKYMTVYQFCERPDGTVWFVSLNGIYFYKDSKITRFNDSPMNFPMEDIRSIACDAEGTLWFGSTSSGIATYNENGWNIYDTASEVLPDNSIRSITAHGDEMWISTRSGIAMKDKNGWITFTVENSAIPNPSCKDIVIDSDNYKWIATGETITGYDDTEWKEYDPSAAKTPFGSKIVRLHIENSNALTLISNTGECATLQDSIWSNISPEQSDKAYYSKMTSIFIDGNTNPWIGTHNGEIHHFNGVNWKTFEYPRKETAYNHSELPPDFGAMDLVLDSKGDLWVAADQNKLGHFNGKTWTMYDNSNSNGAYLRNMLSVAVDSNGHIWTGQYSQIQKFDGEKWTTFDKTTSENIDGEFHTITFDSEGVLWAGSSKKGLIKYDGRTWKAFNTQNSDIPYNDVSYIAIDQLDNKWLLCDRYGYGSILAQFHETGIKSTRIIETINSQVSKQISVQSNSSKVRLTFPVSQQKVTLNLFDLKGRLVKQHSRAATKTGSNHLEFNHSGLSDGLYLYQLKAGINVYSGKIALKN